MPAISKAQLAAAANLPKTQFFLPELGKDAFVWIRSLTAKELLALQEKYKEGGDTSNLAFACDVLAHTLIDDAGSLLFTTAEEVVGHLGISLKAFTLLAEAALEISGILAPKN